MILNQDISSIASMMGVTAHHFKVLQISEDAVAEFHGEGGEWSLRTSIKAGLEIDLTSYGSPCTQIVFESDNPQKIRFWAGVAKASDSSLSGAVGIDSANRAEYPPIKTISVATEIFAANTVRKQGTYQIDKPCYVNDAVNGILLPAGIYSWENKMSLTLHPTVANVAVRSLDELF